LSVNICNRFRLKIDLVLQDREKGRESTYSIHMYIKNKSEYFATIKIGFLLELKITRLNITRRSIEQTHIKYI